MNREAEYEADEICDICGEEGAFDFYGDYICEECLGGDYDKEQFYDPKDSEEWF